MTFEEAAATLGLTPAEATAGAVERNYREKVKRCHPDVADYPGAAVEFKRATKAFDTLRGRAPQAPRREAPRSELDAAAERFRFTAWFDGPELWETMGFFEKARALGGVRVRPVDLREVPRGMPLVIRTFGPRVTKLNPLLVAPVDVEILADKRREDDGYEMTLRPLETDRVRDWLTNSVAEGMSLDAACQGLAFELSKASRAPLFASKNSEGRAA